MAIKPHGPNLTRRNFLKIPFAPLKGGPSFERKTNYLNIASNIIFNDKDRPTLQDDDQSWLDEGWTAFKPKPNYSIDRKEIQSLKIPFNPNSVPENIQLLNEAALQTLAGPKFFKAVYPILDKFLQDDINQQDKLQAYSYANSLIGGGRQLIQSPVKIIYAAAQDAENGVAGTTKMRISGDNKIEYAIIIRLNPAGIVFKDEAELKHWIQAVYVHEMMHVKQRDRRWLTLIQNNRNPTQVQIYKALNGENHEFDYTDEAQAYWVGMQYAQLIHPDWFRQDTSPKFVGLKKSFLKLLALGMDPLIEGEKIKSSEFDEKMLEKMWLYMIYFNLNYQGLILSSKIDSEHVGIIKNCFSAGLISQYEYESYLQQVDTAKYEEYKMLNNMKTTAGNALRDVSVSLFSPEIKFIALGVTGFAALLLAIRMRGK